MSMDSYNNGTWGVYTGEIADRWDSFETSYDNGLEYIGYRKAQAVSLGDEFGCSLQAYEAKDSQHAEYRYFVCISFNGGELYHVLVPTFGSLFMLMKDFLPFIEKDSRERRGVEQEEEHLWKAKDRRAETGERNFCGHI